MRKCDKVTVQAYDAGATAYSRHFANSQSRAADIIRAHGLAAVPLGWSKVVEIGCGDGRDAKDAFASASEEYIGYDPSVELLKIARSRFPCCSQEKLDGMFRRGCAQCTVYPESRDIMIAVNSVVHVPPEDLSAMYDRVAAGLRVGGIVYVMTKVEDAGSEVIYHDRFGDFEADRYFYHHDPTLLVRTAVSAGLKLVHHVRTPASGKVWDWYTYALRRTS